MNRFSYKDVYQRDSLWFVNYFGTEYPFADGITFHPDYKVTGAGKDPRLKLKLKKQVKIYVNEFMKKLVAKKIPKPGGGDCWMCHLISTDDKKKTMGDMGDGAGHLMSHIKEKYYVPSLLMNVLEEYEVSDWDKAHVGYWLGYLKDEVNIGNDYTQQHIAKCMRRYLYRRLGMAA